MAQKQRLAFLAAAIVVLGIAFVLVQPDDDEDDATPTTTQQAATPAQTAPAEPAATATTPAAPAQPAAVRVRVRGGRPVGGVETIEVDRGDRARFTVTSDQPDEVHVHGYDLEREVGPDAPARFSFTADADGVFEVELHGSGAQIASLEVQP
jgi:plastocyanin